MAEHNEVAYTTADGNDYPAHATAIILSLAAGEVSEESLIRWIRDNWPSAAR